MTFIKVGFKYSKCLAYAVILLQLSACSWMLPGPDRLNEDLDVPMGKWGGEHRYYDLLPVDADYNDYSRQEYFKGDFRGNDVEFLVNVEKEKNDLIMVASALAGQPIFAIKQTGRQLSEEQSYFDLKGLKFSWILADYQWVHLPLAALRPPLSEQGILITEEISSKACEQGFFTQPVLMLTRHFSPLNNKGESASEHAFLTIQYFVTAAAAKAHCSLAITDKNVLILQWSDVEYATVKHSLWKYSYTVKRL